MTFVEVNVRTGLNAVGCGVQDANQQHPWLATLSTNYGLRQIESFDFCSATLLSNTVLLTGNTNNLRSHPYFVLYSLLVEPYFL